MSNPSQFQYTIKNALRYLYKVYDSTLQFINKMTEPTQDNINIQPLLSPKQAQERRARTTTLQNIDKQIEDILAMNTIKHIQFEDFAHSLNTLQTVYVKENKELKEAIRKLKNDYECLQKMYLTTKQKLELSIDHLEQKTIEYQRMQKETIKLKKMVHNQQTLLDDYRKNIEEEIALQRELMNSMYEENKNKLQKEFNHALQQIQKQYQQKIKKISNHCKAKQYRTQCNQLKKYLQSNKELLGKPNNRPDKTSCKPISSEYSTNDQQTRHNTAIFMP